MLPKIGHQFSVNWGDFRSVEQNCPWFPNMITSVFFTVEQKVSQLWNAHERSFSKLFNFLFYNKYYGSYDVWKTWAFLPLWIILDPFQAATRSKIGQFVQNMGMLHYNLYMSELRAKHQKMESKHAYSKVQAHPRTDG